MFCGCSTDLRRRRAEHATSARSAWACPGTLPVINRRAVEHVLATGVAIGATTPEATRWDRKNYFYPDLPKGYQISQYDLPLAAARPADVRDVGRPGHDRHHPRPSRGGHGQAASTPDADGPAGQPGRLQPLRARRSWRSSPSRTSARPSRRAATRRSCGCCCGRSARRDADMERGQMRVEANVSLRPRGTEPFGTRVEVKNMNSFRSVERAIAFEIERQAAALDAGEPLRPGDARLGRRPRRRRTAMRSRRRPTTTATSRSRTCRRCASTRPGSPRSAPRCRSCRRRAGRATRRPRAVRLRRGRARRASRRDARCSRRAAPRRPERRAARVANWVTGEYLGLRKADARRRGGRRVDPARARRDLVARGRRRASSRARTPRRSSRARGDRRSRSRRSSRRRGLRQISDSRRSARVIDEVLAANPAAVADVAAGKPQAIGFLIGQVMKATRGQANAALVQDAVRARARLDRLTDGHRQPRAPGRGRRVDRARRGAGARPVAAVPGARQQQANVARYESGAAASGAAPTSARAPM